MKLLTQNSKIKKSSKDSPYHIFNFGITAVKACPFAGSCKKGCYATMGAYAFGNVKSAFDKRFDITKTPEFVSLMSAEIETKLKTATKRGKTLLIRIHDSGDFYSRAYVSKWYDIMRAYPQVKFYAYTKSLPYFNIIATTAAGTDVTMIDPKKPSNFVLIFSQGGKLDHLINIYFHRHARVFETLKDLESAGYADASNNDLVAIGNNPKIGLVYHGNKSYKNTEWNEVY